jgi:transposase-like protein
MRLLARLEEWLREERIFERERTPNDRRALGIFLYVGGLSCWRAGEAVGVSQEAVTEWFEKARAFFKALRPRRRKRIAVDDAPERNSR